jgi:2-aminoethylphosphonate-pyruvate transaminase
VIYPGKVTSADTFRIGTIGHVFPEDIDDLVRNVGEVAVDMNLSLG